jgi:preprotein translocase subunit YajC
MINTLLLQAPAPGGGAGMMNLLMIALIFVIFYFFMIRPQMKKAKVERQFRETIKKGDKIVTIGGIHGRVLEVESASTLMVEIDHNVKVRLERSAVSVEATRALASNKEETKK